MISNNKNYTPDDSSSYSNYRTNVLRCFTCVNGVTRNMTDSAKSSISQLFLCPLCGEVPEYYCSYNGTADISPHVHFHCHSCPYQWMLCRLCSNQMQPTLLSKRDQRRRIKRIFSNLCDMMKEHTKIYHDTNDQNDSTNTEDNYSFLTMILQMKRTP